MFSCRPRFVVLIGALPLALSACGDQAKSDARTEPPLVRVATVQEAPVELRSFTGTVAARVESGLGFRVSGKVVERLVDTGQIVKRGQPLMRIDPIDLKLMARAQQEAVVAAQARVQQTAGDESRYRDLRGTGAISASAYDQIKASADAAKAQLAAAEAQAAVANNATLYAELVADGDGVVVETVAEPGQVVSAGQVVIRVAHAGAREAVIQLPETLRPNVGSVGRATLFGKKEVAVPVRLRQLSDAADRLTRTFEARYVLEGALATAPLGATVTVQIPDEHLSTQYCLQVPMGSLHDEGKGSGLWIIKGAPATVSWRPVEIERLGDDSACVAGQIEQGDRIVALGAHLLREASQVRVSNGNSVAAIVGVLP